MGWLFIKKPPVNTLIFMNYNMNLEMTVTCNGCRRIHALDGNQYKLHLLGIFPVICQCAAVINAKQAKAAMLQMWQRSRLQPAHPQIFGNAKQEKEFFTLFRKLFPSR